MFFFSDSSYSMAHIVKTRKKSGHALFGAPSDLPTNQLPTVGDVLRLIWKYKGEEASTNLQFASKTEAIKQAVIDVNNIWETAVADRTKGPLISDKAIIGRITRIYDTGLDITRILKTIANKQKVEKFKESMDSCSCSCSRISCKEFKCTLKE